MFIVLLLWSILCASSVQAVDEKPMVVVIPSYHNAYKPPHSKTAFYEDNLGSVLGQNYSNDTVIYVADADYMPDSDGTGALVEQYIKNHPQGHRVTLIRNKDRALALKNMYKAILSCDDETIIVLVDGDDQLARPNVLSRLNEKYSQPGSDFWFVYGSFKIQSNGVPWGYTREVPQEFIDRNAVREWGNGPSHVKTFKAWLFKQLKIEDLFYKDDFYTMAWDVAMFSPMLEMSLRGNHVAMIPEVMYVYNDINPLNDHKVDRSLQIALDHYVRSLPAYQPLTESKSGLVDRLKKQGLLKADLVVFSHGDHERLAYCLSTLCAKIKNYAHIYAVDEKGVVCLSCGSEVSVSDMPVATGTMTFADLFVEGSAPYILFVSDNAQPLSHDIDLEHVLYWLETTHAYGFNMVLDRKTFDVVQKLQPKIMPTVQITLDADSENTIYGWRFNQQAPGLNEVAHMMLYRKKDVQVACANPLVTSQKSLEKVLKQSLRGTEVYLFYRGCA